MSQVIVTDNSIITRVGESTMEVSSKGISLSVNKKGGISLKNATIKKGE